MSEIIVKDGLRFIRGVIEPETSKPNGHDAGPSQAETDSKSQKSNKQGQEGFPPNFLMSKGGLFWKDPENDDKPTSSSLSALRFSLTPATIPGMIGDFYCSGKILTAIRTNGPCPAQCLRAMGQTCGVCFSVAASTLPPV
jgi:hypothetical protein